MKESAGESLSSPVDRDESSWFYWAALRSWAVRLSIAFCCLITVVVMSGIVLSVNPTLLPSVEMQRWNYVRHVENLLFHRALGAASVRGAAVGKRWIALATQAHGLVVFQKAAGVGFSRLDTAIDVSESSQDDQFFAATEDQRLWLVNGGFGSIRDLLPESVQPTWIGDPARDRSSGTVVANALDSEGWLLAVPGRGVARYVFSPDGRRSRSFLLTKLSAVPLTLARVSDNGVWLALARGSLQFADRHTLNADPARQLQTNSEIQTLDGDYGGTWATARTAGGQLWMFQAGSGWQGPYFGDSTGGILTAANDVRLVRLGTRSAWLGADDGLFVYDRVTRHITKHLNGKVVSLEWTDPTRSGLLAAGPSGLIRFSDSPGYAQVPIDHAPVEWVSESPDGTLLVYRTPDEIRTSQAPFASVSTLMTINGLPPRTPQIAAVREIPGGLLFVTHNGDCFIQEESHSYFDCPKTRVTSSGVSTAQLQSLVAIDRIDSTNEDVLAVAGGHPYRLFSSGNSKEWVSLGNPPQPVRRLTRAGNRIFAVGRDGSIYAQGRDFQRMFERSSLLNTEFIGDATTGVRWRLAGVFGNNIGLYDSPKATWSETPIHAAITADGGVAQLRLNGEQAILRSVNGRVFKSDGAALFGGGQLLFSRRDVSAIAPHQSGVLVGGPAGGISLYSWSTGSWSTLQSLGSTSSVTQIELSAVGYWATAGGALYFSRDPTQERWTAFEGYENWTLDPSGSTVWLSGPRGVARLTVTKGQVFAAAMPLRDSDGIRTFVEDAVFAWPIDAQHVGFVGSGSGIGIYDSIKDEWTVISKPARILPAASRVAWHGQSGGVTVAYLEDGRIKLRKWSLQPGVSFSQEEEPVPLARDLAFTADGDLWALLGDRRLVRVLTDGPLQVANSTARDLPNAVSSITDAANLPKARGLHFAFTLPGAELAISDFGSVSIAWGVGANSRVAASWKRPTNRSGTVTPIWGACGDKLLIDCVRRVSFNGSGRLQVFTQGGLLLRNAQTFAVESWDPSVPPPPVMIRTQPQISSGPWIWKLEPSGLHIVHMTDGRERRWTAINGVGFEDDVVVYVGRQAGELTITTRDGRTHRFNPTSGRSEQEISAPGERWQDHGVVLNVEYDSGRVKLSSPDGKPLFIDGRFYFDRPSDIVGGPASLFEWIDGRGILERDPADLGQMRGFWPFPSGVASGNYGLEIWAGGVFLRNVSAGPSWELDTAKGLWRRVEPAETRFEASMAPIIWKKPAAMGSAEPYIQNRTTTRPIRNWWSVDRFSWDRILCGAALSADIIGLLTPIGILEWNNSRWIDIHELSGYTSCSIPRRAADGAPTGLLISGSRGQSSLVQITAGALTIGAPAGAALEAKVRWRRDGDTIDLEERWQTTGAALSSDIPDLPTNRLMFRGQFVFDQARGGAPYQSGWLTFAACPPDRNGPCTFSYFVSANGALVLRDVWTTPIEIDSLRIDAGDALIGRRPDKLWRSAWKGDWREIPKPSSAGPRGLFRNGDPVYLDLEKLEWSRRTSPDEDLPVFQLSRPDYPLFSSTKNGMGLSFDIVTSIATNRAKNELTLATMGGTLRCDLTACSSNFGLVLKRPIAPTGPTDIERARYDVRDQLHLRRFDRSILPSAPSWEDALAGNDFKVHFDTPGVELGGRPITTSDNAWGIGNESINGAVDFAIDRTDGSLWIATSNRGLFRVLLRQPRR